MKKQGKVKHSKIRNTGLLFEFLLRQITADILDKEQNSYAVKIMKKRFNERTELGKELALYNVILNKKFNTDKKANFLIKEVLDRRNDLNHSLLRREKYNLIKELKEKFDLTMLLSSNIKNYKVYASIYKLFESSDTISPDEKTEIHFNLVEHITKHNLANSKSSNYKNLPQNQDLRILSYKILLEKFNEKYSKLNIKQKSLLKEYINNISNTNSLREYVKAEILYVKKQLMANTKHIDDKITKIKLNEAVNSIDKICKLGTFKNVKDNAIVQLMRYYELIKQLKKHA